MVEDTNINDIDEENDELFEKHKIVVDPGQTLMRIDKYLSNTIKNTSRNRIQNAIATESVWVNNEKIKASYKIKPDDVIEISLALMPQAGAEIVPQDIPISIHYEDDDLLLVNKDPEMVVHPGHNNWDGTLVNALAYHFNNLPNATDGQHRPGLVHRIDKGTSGLLVIAKNEFALQFLAKQFAEHTTERTYYALIWGEPKEDKGTINAHIGRAYKDRRISEVFPDGEHGRPSITHWEVIKRLRYVSLIKCNLETGRTHQIRAHMKYIGHPLFGDKAYGGDQILRGDIFSKYKQFVENCMKMLPRQALHAKSLGFVHPVTKEFMQFETPLPEDFQTVLEKWEHYLQYN